MAKLEGKVALITGAGRGIGRALARKLAAEGARLVLNDIDAGPLDETAAGLDAETVLVPGDVAETGFGARFVGAALERFRTLDLIVNNAGYIWNRTIHNTTDEQWQAMLDANATAPFRILRAAAPYLRQAARAESAAGRPLCRKVVNVSSVSGVHGIPGHLAYGAAKTTLIGLTRVLAKEWGPLNVTVNCVAFGFIDTRLTHPADGPLGTMRVGAREVTVGLPRADAKALMARTPLGRIGTPEEAAGAIYLFLIPESDFITGELLVCSGGLSF